MNYLDLIEKIWLWNIWITSKFQWKKTTAKIGFIQDAHTVWLIQYDSYNIDKLQVNSIETNSSVWKEDNNLFTMEYVEMWKSLVK